MRPATNGLSRGATVCLAAAALGGCGGDGGGDEETYVRTYESACKTIVEAPERVRTEAQNIDPSQGQAAAVDVGDASYTLGRYDALYIPRGAAVVVAAILLIGAAGVGACRRTAPEPEDDRPVGVSVQPVRRQSIRDSVTYADRWPPRCLALSQSSMGATGTP